VATCSLCLRDPAPWIGALLLLVWWSGHSLAAETAVTPTLELRQEYTDNFFYRPAGRIGTIVTRVSPWIKAAAKTELLSVSLAARHSLLRYSNPGIKDDQEQVYEGTGSYRLTPRLKFSGSAAYRREAWPDREIELSGQALNLTSRRQNYGAGAQYQISELTLGTLGYGNEQTSYSDNSRSSDLATHNVSAAFQHDADRWLSLLKLRGAASFSRSDYTTTQTEIENYQLTLGASWRLHELWSVSADAGGRYTRSGFLAAPLAPPPGLAARREVSDSKGVVFKTSLDYGGEWLTGSLAYSRDLNTSSGQFGTAVERDALTFSLNRRLAYELFAVAGGGYYRSKADSNQFGSQPVDETSWRGSLSLRYQLSPDWAADLGYDHFRRSTDSPGSSAYRNKVFFQVTGQTSFFE